MKSDSVDTKPAKISGAALFVVYIVALLGFFAIVSI